MNFYTILALFVILTLGAFSINSAYAQIDPLSSVEFLQTGELVTDKHQFQISNDITFREFFDGKIVRISGLTVEGFPYIVYSKILDDKVDIHGIIFISGKFVDLMFVEPVIIKENESQKKDDLVILIQYPSQVENRQFAYISTKIFDKELNRINNFNQKTGLIPDVNIEILVLDGRNEEFFSTNGTTNNSGFFETRFWIPDNYRIDTLTVTIDAENENSKSSKIFQIHTIGRIR